MVEHDWLEQTQTQKNHIKQQKTPRNTNKTTRNKQTTRIGGVDKHLGWSNDQKKIHDKNGKQDQVLTWIVGIWWQLWCLRPRRVWPNQLGTPIELRFARHEHPMLLFCCTCTIVLLPMRYDQKCRTRTSSRCSSLFWTCQFRGTLVSTLCRCKCWRIHVGVCGTYACLGLGCFSLGFFWMLACFLLVWSTKSWLVVVDNVSQMLCGLASSLKAIWAVVGRIRTKTPPQKKTN